MSSRLISSLVGLGLVAIAAAGLQLSEVGSEHQRMTGTFDKPVQVNAGEVRVSRVRVATALETYGRVSEQTDGVFVIVTVTGAATGRDQLAFGNPALVSGKVRYDGYFSSSGIRADPGFESTTDLAFEVDPAHLDDDVALEMRPSEIVSGYQEQLHIELGQAAEPGSWAAAARDQVVDVRSPERRAIP